MKKKIKIVTFGCKANQYESKAFENQLLSLGYDISNDDQFDICIVNSCTVTKNAENTFLKTIKNLKNSKENLKKKYVIFENTKKEEFIRKVEIKNNIFDVQVTKNTKDYLIGEIC
ncbi:MAG: tRNA-2-methylthio-N(6)-dimethylallyladenosine synthase [Candidatus Anoxychlamydiales bacterium]|nr:tRNA-2-methylthio-N(6)-dimethylallyladenosine synthase [Candidatus Anoxychlamydiales bacterium]